MIVINNRAVSQRHVEEAANGDGASYDPWHIHSAKPQRQHIWCLSTGLFAVSAIRRRILLSFGGPNIHSMAIPTTRETGWLATASAMIPAAKPTKHLAMA